LSRFFFLQVFFNQNQIKRLKNSWHIWAKGGSEESIVYFIFLGVVILTSLVGTSATTPSCKNVVARHFAMLCIHRLAEKCKGFSESSLPGVIIETNF
jgi:hypothetical protein